MPTEPELPTSNREVRLPSGVPLADLANGQCVVRGLPSVGGGPSCPAGIVTDLPVEATTVAVEGVESRRVRIARATAAGGLKQLPEQFDERDGDWQTITSDNPFEVLYLDHERHAAITVELVERHYHLIDRFWREKVSLMQQSAAKLQIVRKYGGPGRSEQLIKEYPARAAAARQRLVAHGGIAAEFMRLDARRRQLGEEALAPVIGSVLADGVLEPAETSWVLGSGAQFGLTEDETASCLEQALRTREFQAVTTPASGSAAVKLASVTWKTADRLAADAEAREAAAAAAVKPFKFERASATSLAELIELCDRYPEEAQDYFYHGYFESWLTVNFGEAKLGLEARAIQKAYSKQHRHRGLELFVRVLCHATDRPAVPQISVLPPVVDFGASPVGALGRKVVNVQITGRRRAWGTVRCEPELPGLMATPAMYDGEGGGALILSLDTVTAPPGEYKGEIVVDLVGVPETQRVLVRYSVLPLAVHVDPPVLTLGRIPHGQSRSARVRVATTPKGGRLAGAVAMSPDIPGVEIGSDAAAAGANTVAGEAFDVTVRVGTGRLRAGTTYKSSVYLTTNVGPIRIPVSFRVSLVLRAVLGWMLALGLVGAGVLWEVRTTLARAAPELSSWYQSYRSAMPETAGAARCFFIGLAACLWLLGRLAGGKPTQVVAPPAAPDAAAGKVP